MTFEATREGRFEPRYKFEVASMIKTEFCQQIGQYDIWITPHEVLVVPPPNRGTDLSKYQAYNYEHACQRFPLVEHKLLAMRAMIFGAN